MKINYLSEFKLIERFDDADGLVPFRYTYYTSKSEGYVVSYDGQEYVNCRCETDGELLVIFENHALNLGELHVKREYFLSDTDFADGVCNVVSVERTNIELTMGKSEGTEVTTELLNAYAQGESAYDIACRNGFEGSEQEWLVSLASGAAVIYDFDSSTASMQPNIYYYHSSAPTAITISLAESQSQLEVAEYMLFFAVGEDVPTFTYPDSVVWVGCVDDSGVPELSASKSYEVNIVDGRGVIVEW